MNIFEPAWANRTHASTKLFLNLNIYFKKLFWEPLVAKIKNWNIILAFWKIDNDWGLSRKILAKNWDKEKNLSIEMSIFENFQMSIFEMFLGGALALAILLYLNTL